MHVKLLKISFWSSTISAVFLEFWERNSRAYNLVCACKLDYEHTRLFIHAHELAKKPSFYFIWFCFYFQFFTCNTFILDHFSYMCKGHIFYVLTYMSTLHVYIRNCICLEYEKNTENIFHQEKCWVGWKTQSNRKIIFIDCKISRLEV